MALANERIDCLQDFLRVAIDARRTAAQKPTIDGPPPINRWAPQKKSSGFCCIMRWTALAILDLTRVLFFSLF